MLREETKFKLLVTNDDGINAPGLIALVKHLTSIDCYSVYVIAPAKDNSACGHSISVHGVLESELHDFGGDLSHVKAHKVYGTPVDCIKLATTVLSFGERYDLVLSGINRGNNTGLNALASGTVAAALNARVCGLNAVALSLDQPTTYVSGEPHEEDFWNYQLAAKMAIPIIDEILQQKPLEGILLNINFPNVRTEQELKGIKKTRQGWSSWNSEYKELPKNGNRQRWEIHGTKNLLDKEDFYDSNAIRNGWITVTPLGVHFDPSHTTDYQNRFEALEQWSFFTK